MGQGHQAVLQVFGTRLPAPHQRRFTKQTLAAVQADTDAQLQPALVEEEQGSSSSSASDSDDAPPRGCSRYSVSLKKPLGLVLEQDSAGRITIAEIAPEGAADKTGLCAVVRAVLCAAQSAACSDQRQGWDGCLSVSAPPPSPPPLQSAS